MNKKKCRKCERYTPGRGLIGDCDLQSMGNVNSMRCDDFKGKREREVAPSVDLTEEDQTMVEELLKRMAKATSWVTRPE